MTKKEAQNLFLDVINSVEAGLTTPEDAVKEQEIINANSEGTVKFDYTVEDFKAVRSLALSTLVSDEEDYDLIDEFESEDED